MEITNNFIERINNGPILLFLGQQYNAEGDNPDYFIRKVREKYSIQKDIPTYDIIFEDVLKSNPQFIDWADKLLNDIPDPKWFDELNEIPFSSVFTSSLNSKLLKSFRNHYRTTSGIYNEKQRVINPRDPHNLHINYLFGCFNQTDNGYKIPTTIFEKSARKHIASTMNHKIAEYITPLGILLIESYNPNHDWLKIEDLYPIMTSLSNSQTYWFSATVELEQNPYIQELIKQNKIVLIQESLSKYFSNLKENGVISNQITPYDSFDGHWVNIGAKRYKVPTDIYNRISKSATILEAAHFNHPLKLSSDEALQYFKDFLANSSTLPRWSGFPLKFGFKRKFYSEIKEKAIRSIQNNKLNTILCLHGQASSGKTIALGLLAYEFFTELKVPILFIERKYTRINENDIDVFYNWAEQNGADKIIVIWDGMYDPSQYSGFLKRLEARGKNILLICSSYKVISNRDLPDNYIEAKINLDKNEIKDFKVYITNFYPNVGALIKHFNEDNFLAMLYRYLDSSRYAIKESLNKELFSASKNISDEVIHSDKKIEFDSNSLAFHLREAGIIKDEELLNLEREIEIAGDNLTVANKLLYLVMVPGQFGLLIPFDLLIRAIGLTSFNQDLFKALQRHDILKWHDDSVGNLSISSRTTLEAQLIVRALGGLRAQAEYIKDLIKSLREFDSYDYSDSSEIGNDEIQFAAELLYHISPNSDNNNFVPFLYEFSLELSNLRETGAVVNPRLMLQEATFLRELVMKNVSNIPLSHAELLNKAEYVLTEAIQMVTNKKSASYKILQVELCSILGSKLKNEVNKSSFNKEVARDFFNTTYNQLINSSLLSKNSYHALDVLCWSSKAALQKNILTQEERLAVEIMLLHLFDLYESEGVEEVHKDEFLQRQIEFGEIIERESISNEAFKKLEEKGSAAGYYIKTKNMIGNISLNSELLDEVKAETINSAYNYLNSNLSKIKNDPSCYFLLFKLWWMTTTKHGLINGEQRLLKFNQNDWIKAVSFTEELKSFGENYYTSTIKYLHGICLFHIGRLNECIDLFRELNNETDFSLLGKKRIVKSYIASDFNGNTKVFSGEVRYAASLMNNQTKGDIYVPELRISVPFLLRDFQVKDVIAKQSFSQFNIAFNFRGLIATPVK